MTANTSTLECLPNEILLEIFKNLDARCLFRAFYDLNIRFNTLLQSPDHQLTIFPSNSSKSIDDQTFVPYIDTLIIKTEKDINFDHFTNIRRVVRHYQPVCSMRNLDLNLSSKLEHLSVLTTHLWLLTFSSDFIQKIFSNVFPYLKSCCLPDKATLVSNENWTESPSLRIFKVGYIQSKIYKAILLTCPNLYSLKFTKWPKDKSTFNMEAHMNLKRLSINMYADDFLASQYLHGHFSCIPKLEQLTIHVTLRDPTSVLLVRDCDWFSSIIEKYCSALEKFSCYLIFTPSTHMNQIDIESIFNEIKENFQNIHKNNRYQSKILFKLLK